MKIELFTVCDFAADYAVLHEAGAAQAVQPEAVVAALTADNTAMAARARALSDAAEGALQPLAIKLLKLAGLA